MNFTSRAHNIVMVSSMAKWSFILVFCKRLSCLQPLSKKFKLFVFFSNYEGGEAPWVGLAPLGWE